MLLGSDIKTEKKGDISNPFAEIAYAIRKVHSECGDSAFIHADKNRAILAVLDGVSGEPGAEAASSVAAFAILNYLKKRENITSIDLQDALIHGHNNIIMGSTTALIVVIEKDGSFICASVGDCALYSLDKNGEIKLQIEPMRAVGKGSAIFRFMMLRNLVGSVLGTREDLDIYSKKGKLDPGEFLLLMSDGITDNLKIKTKEGNVDDCSGEYDLAKIIGKQADVKKIVGKIKNEVWHRIQDKVEVKEENESLIIKPDDFALIGFKLKEKKSKTQNRKRKS
jgi:serine/threonine protein phosphatase PrpC